MPKKYTLADLHASDTNPALRAEMMQSGVLKVCPPDKELGIVHRQRYFDADARDALMGRGWFVTPERRHD